jgi:cytochrome c5
MPEDPVRGVAAPVSALLALAVAASACDAGVTRTGDGDRLAYLRDPTSRRAALIASLVNPNNAYSTLRLARYASGTAMDWERLPTWNPRVAPVAVDTLDALPSTSLPDDARALELPDEATWDATVDLTSLGEEAFFRYPVQLAPPVALTATSPQRYGLWQDAGRGVGGLVRAQVPGGGVLALTCATCHADVLSGRLVAGVPSGRFDLGRMLVDAGAPDAQQAARVLAWGPGRVDVTTADASLPERISDLRPTRWLSHLQYDATVQQRDLVALAIRIETLIITSHGETLRPPRIVALALAQYHWSLAPSLPTAPPPPDAFTAHCAACHAGEGLTGLPRGLAEVGTDPTLGLSPDRGTGFYRVPSLRGTGTRPTLLHDGSVPDLAAMFDPARLGSDWTGGAREPGAVTGHLFGIELSPAERATLVDYLRAL